MATKKNKNKGVRTSDIVRAELKALHDTNGLSWRKIAILPQYKGIPPGTLNSIYKGADVFKIWKEKLGIKREVPLWVIEATEILAQLEKQANAPIKKRIYSRGGKRVR